MSRFGNTDYSASGGSTSGQDYKDRESILLGTYAILEGTLGDFSVYENHYGLNIIPGFDDAEVLEGVITHRVEEDSDGQGKTKVMGWDKWFDRDENMELEPMVEGGEISTDELGRRVTEEAGGDKYKYQISEGVLEGRDEPVSVGDVELWLGNGKKARTIAKVFSQHGHDIIDDKDDDRNWLTADDHDDFALRPELEDRRVMIWFEQVTLTPDDVDDLDQTITYTDAVILDAETEAPITILNDEEDDEAAASDDSDGDDSDGDAGGSEAAESADDELPSEVEELVDMFARTGQTDRDSIENIVRDEAPDSYEVDMDTVMNEVKARA